ncbi:hypothetical protein FA13DRAFT_1297385 [Coprinellus micaceus]|uniref:EF-hand domain-containing protein n=1 Tax=Coprinellus micaceus TaxID=71717 RepID=A0A4Y7SS54_COPMI|nr:hypothetical protein FA13DRAFT_1297385 [Coprinellus micaceus]
MVKLAVTFVFTAALAIATVRAQEAGAETVEEVLSRDVSSTDSDLFGRAAAKVMNDLFSREELSEVYGRDFDGDLTWRDVTELVERESIDMSEVEELAARAAAPQQAPDEPKHKASSAKFSNSSTGSSTPSPRLAPTLPRARTHTPRPHLWKSVSSSTTLSSSLRNGALRMRTSWRRVSSLKTTLTSSSVISTRTSLSAMLRRICSRGRASGTMSF